MMNVLVGVMFLTVITTAALIKPDLSKIAAGLIPNIPTYVNPDGKEQGVVWTLALMGGVGGTLTILSYGYWIKEKGRSGTEFLRTCRIDLAAAYVITAIFGISMIIISSQIDLDKESSSKLIIVLSEKLESILGSFGAKLFLVGAWAAVFTSLLGVWQSVPYMFADFWEMFRNGKQKTVDTKSKPYRYYLIALALIPMIGLAYKFVLIQKVYAYLGSFVIPLIAVALLFMNSRSKSIGEKFRNHPTTIAVIILILAIFIFIALQ